MTYLDNILRKADRKRLEKSISDLDLLKGWMEADEKFAKDQLAKHSQIGRRVTLASAQRRRDAEQILQTATYRVERCCEARNALRSLLGSCPEKPAKAAEYL